MSLETNLLGWRPWNMLKMLVLFFTDLRTNITLKSFDMTKSVDICQMQVQLCFSATSCRKLHITCSVGRSVLVWTVLICRFKLLLTVNLLPQTSHWYLGPTPLWTIFRCRLKWPLAVNFLKRRTQVWGDQRYEQFSNVDSNCFSA